MLDRKNKLIRPFVTNITQLFIVLASVPEPDFLLIDKLIINAKMNEIEPILILNKCDLSSNLIEIVHNEYDNANIKILEVSTKTGHNIDKIKQMLKDNISALAGQSATGKTSIINLITNQNRKTNNLSKKVMRGKNTTTNAELILIDNNSFVLDTAGFSKIEFEQLNPILIKDYYDEFKNFNCSFKDCKHIFEGEKFCGVIKNLGDKINKNRYERYKQIYLECEKNWSNRYE